MSAHRRAPRPPARRGLRSRSSAPNATDRRPSTLEADLAFDPNQLRDIKGRWTDDAVAAVTARYHELGGDPSHKIHVQPIHGDTSLYVKGEGTTLASLKWYPDGKISFVQTHARHRGKGIAARLLKVGKEIEPRLHHDTNLTPAGRKFAEQNPLQLSRRHPDIIGDIDLAFDPNQPRDAKGQWTASAANIVARWKQATAGERAAGQDWYPAAHRTAVALSKKYGVSVEEAAGLLATYSPQTPWGRNQVEASESLRYGHGLGGPKQAMWFQHDDPTVEDRVGMMATKDTRALGDAVIAGVPFDEAAAGLNKNGTVKPKALKIRSFYDLIAHGGQADPEHPKVVIDRHAMSVAFGERVTAEDYKRLRPASRKQYEPFVAAYQEAAREITRMEGHPVSPETVQATTWLAQQRLNQAEVTQVGKTRKKLGAKDWDEWLKYASLYLGLDAESAAKTGYAELSRVGYIEIDLAFDPNQPRDPHTGQWIDTTPTGPITASEIKGLAAKIKMAKDAKHRAVGKVNATKVTGKPVFVKTVDEPYYDQPEDKGHMSFEDMFTPGHNSQYPGPGPGEETSVATQRRAQVKAEKWAREGREGYDGAEPTDPETQAALIWDAYQEPNNYGSVNAILRGLRPKGVVHEDGTDTDMHFDHDSLMATVKTMFDQAGTTTTRPVTTYRALRNTPDMNWADTLKPGSTFREDGIVSSTAYKRMAQGWLGLNGKSNFESEDVAKIDDQDVVLEIQVPTGSRIVGGVTQFIETMLPPGTQFKIVSSTRTRTPNAINPLGGYPVGGDLIYTHVVAEAILPEDFTKKAPKHRTPKHAAESKIDPDVTTMLYGKPLAEEKPFAPLGDIAYAPDRQDPRDSVKVFAIKPQGTKFRDNATGTTWLKDDSGNWYNAALMQTKTNEDMAVLTGYFHFAPSKV